ncbi:hypothetical protein pipiens_004536 [Culex pipiens pipiens]|uniref:Uncharacterized protein n=1 Tax=Culex pipiens pipiens TaxID=38569 RepID=A0ABD1CHZ2_CULPP
MKVPHGVHRAPGTLGSPSGVPNKQFKKIVTTKYRLPGSSVGGSSSGSFTTAAGNNRHIITSADGVKRLRTATGMEIISKLPTKLPQDTVVSVEGAKQQQQQSTSSLASGIVPISTVSSSGQQRLVSSNSNLSSNSALGSSASSSMTLGELERHFLELKKQTDDLRKQFELSQKQNEEYRARVDKLEKEVQTLKQSSSNNPNNFIEIV